MIPVHLDCTPAEVRGECVRCGKCSTAHVSSDREDGTLAARKKAAKAEVLAELTDLCAERLPWGLTPAHYDRGIPRGLSLKMVDATGAVFPLMVNKSGKLEIVLRSGAIEVPHGGCGFTAKVLVVPDAEKFGDAATAFVEELWKRGYRVAKVVVPGSVEQQKVEVHS